MSTITQRSTADTRKAAEIRATYEQRLREASGGLRDAQGRFIVRANDFGFRERKRGSDVDTVSASTSKGAGPLIYLFNSYRGFEGLLRDSE